MILTGYHGTSKERAEEILANKKFYLSAGDKEWLGTGIYFYTNYYDAVEWTQKRGYSDPAVLHSIIKVKEDEYIDFDCKEGLEILKTFKQLLLRHNVELDPKTVQANQCMIMNLIWGAKPNCKLMIASFAKEPSIYNTLLDERIRRREFCVQENNLIISTNELEVIRDDGRNGCD